MRVHVGVLLTVLGIGLAACGGRGQSRGSGSVAGPAVAVRTAAVVRAGEVGEVTVPAAVQARQRAALSARIPASVVELPFQEGQPVKAGAVVVRLDAAAVQAAVAAAEAGAMVRGTPAETQLLDPLDGIIIGLVRRARQRNSSATLRSQRPLS